MKKVFLLAGTILLAASCTDQLATEMDGPLADASSGVTNANASHRYELTIENLTTGQPLSPGFVATHTRQASTFSVGEPASEGIRLIAENGDPTTALSDLSADPNFADVVNTGGPVGCAGCPGPFGTSLTLEVGASANANRLSMAIMLICTNDGFAGLDGVPLPGGAKPATYYAYAHDAGTEENDESWDSIVDPCGAIGPVAGPMDGTNDHPATSGTVQPHPGIAEVGDLTSDHAWEGPVARVSVRRIQ